MTRLLFVLASAAAILCAAEVQPVQPSDLTIHEWGTFTSVAGEAIEWQNINIEPNTSPALPTETEPSRYYAARGTDSAPIAVGDQHEKFLFYRGVGNFQVPLSARVGANGTIAIENRGADPVPTVILFENRDGRLGYRNAGEIKDAITLDSPSLDSSLPALRTELETALIAQGLYPKEAQAMVETRRDSWFEEGARLIYIVPSHAVDKFLPLEVDPTPSQTARVFVGRIELITPEITRSVENAMASGDWPAIKRYGRFVDSILDRIYPPRIVSENPSMEHQIALVRAKIWTSTNAGACRQP